MTIEEFLNTDCGDGSGSGSDYGYDSIPLLDCLIPARRMQGGELIFDWEGMNDWSKNPDDLEPLNAGWFWVEVKTL